MKPASAQRLWLLTQHALREAAHLRLAWGVALAILVLVAGASVLDEFNFGVERARFFADFAEATLALFGAALAIVMVGALFYGAVENRTLGPLFVRGVRRPEWLLSLLLAVWVALAWLALAVAILLAGLLAWRGHAVAGAPLAARFGFAWLRLALVAGFALTFCCLSRSPLLAVLLSLAFTLAAHLSPVIERARLHGRAMTQAGWTALDWLLPNLAALDMEKHPASPAAYAAGYAALYFLLSCLLFSRREI